jgi:ribonuclease P protein subunit POP4
MAFFLQMSIKDQKVLQTFDTFAEEMVHTDLIPQGKKNASLQYNTKVKGKVLLLEDGIPDYQARKQKKLDQKIKKKKKTMNRKERKRLGLHLIPEESKKWEFFEPLHELWKGYMKQVAIDSSTASVNIYSKFIKADLHGAILTVVQSKCPSNIGISGIVAKDTEQTFVLITRENEMKSILFFYLAIPKKNNVFTCLVNDILITIYGNQYRHRPAERVSKKFKNRETIEM